MATGDGGVPEARLGREGAVIPGFAPESGLERSLVRDPELRRGWAWGRPRRGHPEGAVGRHVAAMLAAIPADDPLRADLRLLTLLHDTFKFRVREGGGYSPDNDHAVLAREFAERHGCPERIAATLELHDAPYWVWHRRGGDRALLEEILARAPDRELLVRFVELDAATLGKDQAFLRWFRDAF
jgi:hypothetical protein